MRHHRSTFLILALLAFSTVEGTPMAIAGHPAKHQSESDVVTNCVNAIGSHWNIVDVKKWADPSFAKLIGSDGGRTAQTFATVMDKLGPVKTVNSVTPRVQEAGRSLFIVDVTCEKAPARLLLEMMGSGKNWKLRAINFDSRELAGTPVPPQVLQQFKQYVDSTIPRLGQKWSFDEFKAEADPIMFHSNEGHVRDQFIKMTGSVGPIVSYQNSQMAERGFKNGVPFATFRSMFISPNGPALAVVVVTLKDNQCKISGFNMGRNTGTAGGATPNMVLPPLQQTGAVAVPSMALPSFQRPGVSVPGASPTSQMPDAQPVLRPTMQPGATPNPYNPTGKPNAIPDELPVAPSLTPELR